MVVLLLAEYALAAVTAVEWWRVGRRREMVSIGFPGLHSDSYGVHRPSAPGSGFLRYCCSFPLRFLALPIWTSGRLSPSSRCFSPPAARPRCVDVALVSSGQLFLDCHDELSLTFEPMPEQLNPQG